MRPRGAREPSGPELLGNILGRVFTLHKFGRRSERLHLEQTWAEIAGPYAEQSRVGSFNRGVLEIVVANGVVLQELAQFHKKKLLAELKARLPGSPPTDLRFRAGEVSTSSDRGVSRQDAKSNVRSNSAP